MSEVRSLTEEPLTDGLGAASGRVVRHRLTLDDGTVTSYVIKELTPLTSGRHAAASRARDHWAWWRDTLYLEDLAGTREDPRTAARRWGAWQATTELPHADWLTSSQLRQRIAVSDLDWTTVEADPRAERLWSRREELLDRFSALEPVLSHGDLGSGNVHRVGHTTVVTDWATLGRAPAGADIAHLTLGAGPEDLLPDYLEGTDGRFDRNAVELAFRITLVLTGSSRVHWMLAQGIVVPDRYVDLLWENRP